MEAFKAYLWRNLIAIDQLFNTIFNGDPDETISSRLGRHLVKDSLGPFKWRQKLCKFLSWIDPRPGNHCKESIGE